MLIQIKKTHDKSVTPIKGSEFAAGYDLFSIDDITTLNPLERKLFKTGIHIKIPNGYYGRIAPRSGLSLKQGIDVMAGVIDSDYLGEIGIILVSLNDTPSIIDTTKPIAQLIIEKHYDVEFDDVVELTPTTRNESGFGSTDVITIKGNLQTFDTKSGGRIYSEKQLGLDTNPTVKIDSNSKMAKNPSLADMYQKSGGIPVREKYTEEVRKRETSE